MNHLENVLRCTELREKLILLSKSICEIEYNALLIFKLFLRTLEREFENINILQEVKPVLSEISLPDKHILAVFQKAVIDQRERQKNVIKREHKVHQINWESEYRHNKSHLEATSFI